MFKFSHATLFSLCFPSPFFLFSFIIIESKQKVLLWESHKNYVGLCKLNVKKKKRKRITKQNKTKTTAKHTQLYEIGLQNYFS